MKYILGIALLIWTASTGLAQENLLRDGTTIYGSSENKWIVDLNAWAGHGSNSITNSFLDKFLFGGFINTDLKRDVSNQLSNENTVGAHAGGRIAITYLRGENQLSWQFSYGYTQIQRIDFEEDLFKLVFEGNVGFNEDVVALNGSNSLSQGYHKWQFGMVETETGSFARIGIYGGANFNQVELGQASVQTSYLSAGGYTFPGSITAVTNGFSEARDGGDGGIFGSGYGLGVDAQINRKFDFGTLSLGVIDFGVMRWTKIENRSSNTETHFDGFEISLDGTGISLGSSEQIVDSIFDVQYDEGSQTRLLPWQISAIYISKGEKAVFTSAQFILRPAAYALPFVNLSVNYKVAKASFIWLSGSAGGPELFGLGAGAQFKVFGDSFIALSTRHAIGWANQNGLARSLSIQFIQRI